MTRECILCGDEFIPRSGHSYLCKKEHVYRCTSCGKEMKVTGYKSIPRFKDSREIIPYFAISNDENRFDFTHVEYLCRECINRRKTLEKKKAAQEYFLKRDKCACDGVGVYLSAENKRICCRKKHYFICSYCDRKILFRSKNDIPIDLPYKILIDNDDEFVITYIDHYCKDCQKNNPSVRRKHNDMIYDRICSNNLEKYGTYSYKNKESLKSAAEKCRRTMLDRYGIEYAFHSESAKERAKIAIHSVEAENKRRATCLERFGVDNYAKTDEYKEYASELASINMKDPEIQRKRKISTLKSIGYEEVYYKPGHAEKMIAASRTPEAKENTDRP